MASIVVATGTMGVIAIGFAGYLAFTSDSASLPEQSSDLSSDISLCAS